MCRFLSPFDFQIVGETSDFPYDLEMETIPETARWSLIG
jgi:hypothetical protein